MPDRQPWQRQLGEPQRAYAGFCIYRDMGMDRSIRKAAHLWLTGPSGKKAAKQRREQRRYASHPKPNSYVKAKARHWFYLSRRWQWVKRVEAWDDHIAAIASDKVLDAQLASKQAELEENERQRVLRLNEARSARTAGRAVIQRFLELIRDQELAEVGMLRHKDVRTEFGTDAEGKPDGTFVRMEIERKGIVELLRLAIPALAEGQRLERLELGEVTDRTEQIVSPEEAKRRRRREIMLDEIEAAEEELLGDGKGAAE